MSRVVFTPKYEGERKRYTVDFSSQLALAEIVVSATVAITVYCGDDPTPTVMLVGPPTIPTDRRVTQVIQGGEVGVIYHLAYVAETSLGETITIHAYFAVIDPDTNVADPECCTRIGNASSADHLNFTMTNTLNPVQDYRHGLPLYVIFNDSLQFDEPTINVDGLGAKDIILTENTLIRKYEIMDDDLLHLVYDADADSGNGAFVLMNKIATQYALFAATDQSAVLTTGEKFNYPGMPSMLILNAWAGVKTVSTSGTPTFNLKADGVGMFSTKITIDANEKSSKTAATQPVFSAREFVGPWILSGEIDVAGTNAAGWNILLKYRARE